AGNLVGANIAIARGAVIYPGLGLSTAADRLLVTWRDGRDGCCTVFGQLIGRLGNATPAGSNVAVSPISGATVTFSQVSSTGDTTVTTTNSGPPLGGGFMLGT